MFKIRHVENVKSMNEMTKKTVKFHKSQNPTQNDILAKLWKFI